MRNIKDLYKNENTHKSIETLTQDSQVNLLEVSKAVEKISRNLNEKVDYSIDYKTKLLDPINAI